jgi:oligopeptidase A
MNAPNEPLVSNPLLDVSGLPRFGEITPDHVAPAIDTLLADARATIERVAAAAATPAWESFVLPLAAAQDRLDRAWGQVVHLNAVVNTPALRKSMPY